MPKGAVISYMKNLKRLTLLHSNDMHGDFFSKEVDDRLIGGVSMLSGYINKVRREEKNALYVVSGDMFRGSLIDSEFKGISTIEIMNLLAPDVVTIGNHEVDYGLAHLLFIEKCARFPIINANMYIMTNHVRLFRSHIIKEIDGMKVLFIGVLTDEVLNQTKQDSLIGSFIDVNAAVREIGKICNAYQTEDIDLTVILTHIGFEEDKKLAASIDPKWSVDVIVGGHSHTVLEEPCMINNIAIVQAGMGTSAVGRMDMYVDTDKNSIDSLIWELIPIDSRVCPRDLALEKIIRKYKEQTDIKYTRVVTRFAEEFTHPTRFAETQLGDVFADIFRDNLKIDIMLIGSGSIRVTSLGPIVEYQNLVEAFPFDDELYRIYATGSQLRRMIRFMLNNVCEALGNGDGAGSHAEFYQFSHGVDIVFDSKTRDFVKFNFDGQPLDSERVYKIGIQKYHFTNIEQFFSITHDELAENRPPKVMSTSILDILEEYLDGYEIVPPPKMGRIKLIRE